MVTINLRSLQPHSNICLFYGVCENESGSEVWIVSELCVLGDLRNLLQKSKPHEISGDLVISFAKDICSGMHFIHVLSILESEFT